MRAYAIVPVLDERDAITAVIEGIPRDLCEGVVVVDGGSRDGTAEAARSAGAVVLREPRRGYGRAVMTGIRKARSLGAEAYVVFDGNGSVDPLDLRRTLELVTSGAADLVIGSRPAELLRTFQWLGNRLAVAVIDLAFGIRYRDVGALRAIDGAALSALALDETGYGWPLQLQARAAARRLRIRDVPVRPRPRLGQSKVSGTIHGTVGASLAFLRVLATECILVAASRRAEGGVCSTTDVVLPARERARRGGWGPRRLRRRGGGRAAPPWELTAGAIAAPEGAVPLPRRLHLELTNRCNSRCRTCVRTARPELEHDLRLDEVQRIVAGLPDLQSAALQVNGEPLLSSRLAEVVRLLVRRGVSVELNTNGTGLDGPRATSLIDARLDRLHVSMDAATPATYRRLRGIDALDTVVANLERFVRLRERSTPALPRLALWMTATRHNLHELPELVELAARIGAEEVYLQRLVYFGAGLAREPDSLQGRLSARQRATIAQAEERASGLGVDLRACGGHTPVEMLCPPEDPEPWRSCRRPRQSAVVMADGDVVPCCIGTFVGNRDAIRMGNLRKTGWHEIWNGARYAQLRADLLAGPGPAFCRPCGVRWSL